VIRESPAAERPFELAVDASPAGIAIVDAAGTIVLVNRAWRSTAPRSSWPPPAEGLTTS
jgi:PAS domain-containing protein